MPVCFDIDIQLELTVLNHFSGSLLYQSNYSTSTTTIYQLRHNKLYYY